MNVWDIESLQRLSPTEFENLVKAVLIKMGFNATTTKASGDGGVDVLAVNEQPIIGGKYVIQCKRYATGNNVGEPITRELYGVMHAENANKGILITTSDFTKQAVDFSQEKAIELINGATFIELCQRYLTAAQDIERFVSQSQIDNGVNAVEKLIGDFQLEIEREKIRTTKNSLDIASYVATTNPGSAFRNDFSNIFEYYQKLFLDIITRAANIKLPGNLSTTETDAFISAAFYIIMEEALLDKEKHLYFSLLPDFRDKAFRLLQKLFSIDPPEAAKDIHDFWTNAAIQFLELFTLSQKYREETDEPRRILYAKCLFRRLIDSSTMLAQFPQKMQALHSAVNSSSQKTGPCFIATAVYGSPVAWEVEYLRHWRDNYLVLYSWGRRFIKYYYQVGPSLAHYVGKSPILKSAVRMFLNAFIRIVLRKAYD